MKPELKFLSQEELVKIHNLALDMLEDMGMGFQHEEARQILEKAGAKVEGEIVKFPRELVERAISTAPKRDELILYGRTEDQDVKISEQAPMLSAMTMATNVIDLDTREKRPATDEDLEILMRIIERLENVKISGAPVTPQDVPQKVCDWYTLATSLKNSTKHLTVGAVREEGVKDAIKMASLALGDGESFKDRPFVSFWILTMPPLMVDDITAGVLVEASKQGAPTMISSGGILGLTSPVTVEGAAVHTHAEILACITLAQMTNPGTPVVYTSFVRGMDMKTSSVAMASPEFAMLKSIMGELGRFLELPTRMPAMLRDAKILDAQAGFETGMVGTIGAFASDMQDSMQFDMDMVVDFADLLYCNECMGQIRRMARGVELTEDKLALDVMKEVGHGGNFLDQMHTAMNFRKEIWRGKLVAKGNWDDWMKNGGLDIKEKAIEAVRKMIEENKDMKFLDKEVEKQIDDVAYQASLRHK